MKGRWQLSLQDMEASDDQPLVVRIAHAISEAIAGGRLSPGARMPGTRTLASQLGVHRNTVVAAYEELCSQGWLRTDPARGTFVNADIEAERRPTGGSRRRAAAAEALGFDLPREGSVRYGLPLDQVQGTVAYGPDMLLLTGGRPDPRLFPVGLLARAYRRTLRREGKRVLDYGDPFGHPRLRAALSEMLANVRALAATPETLLVTRGSQMGLDLAFGALLEPGDRVAIEAYGYPPAWATMRARGATLCPVEVDAQGMCVEQLETLQAEAPLRAIYLTPHHQYPTTTVLSPARRLWLLRFARRHRIAIVEDDYDHEYHYEGRPVAPLASKDAGGNVIYVGSLSKVLAPGLRVGYVVAARPLLERMARMRIMIDRQGDLATEGALAELMEDGEIQRHIWRTRRIYQARRDAFVEALREELSFALTFDVPAGGIAMWARVTAPVSADVWAERALDRRVVVVPGRVCHFTQRKRPFLRIGYTRHDEDELRAGVRALRAALPKSAR